MEHPSPVHPTAPALVPASIPNHPPTPPGSETDEPSVLMRVLISRAQGLAIKDKKTIFSKGSSDPYIKGTIGGYKFKTEIIWECLDPVWNAAFEFEIKPHSVPAKAHFECWDKDRYSKDDYMGIIDIPFDAGSLWPSAHPMHFDDPANQPCWYSLKTEPGKSNNVKGEVEIKFGFVNIGLAPVHGVPREMECRLIWDKLTAQSKDLKLDERKYTVDNVVLSADEIPIAESETDSAQRRKATAGTLAQSELQGVVLMEIVSASDLPPLPNLTRIIGYDMDPFVIVAFGENIFRTKVIRHNLNPVWQANLTFPVKSGEEEFLVRYAVHDWDKFSRNDAVGTATINVNELIQTPCQLEVGTGATNTGMHESEMRSFDLKLKLAEDITVATQDAILHIKAKFVPYETLRKRFWYGLAKASGADLSTGLYSKGLVLSMLEGLGSTLTNETVDGLFVDLGKNPAVDELTFDELYTQLEGRVRLLMLKQNGSRKKKSKSHERRASNESDKDNILYQHFTQVGQMDETDFDPRQSEEEHVIRISTCPICHDSSLGSSSESDVITHIAICSGVDGFHIDKLLMGGFMTEANAERKWLTKLVKSLGYGKMQAGKANANIIIKNRKTGEMLEEKMPTFIRLGIRLLYRGPGSLSFASKMFEDMSHKQGRKFNDPLSKRDIEPFIRFHKLEEQMQEVLEPIENFKNFNEFFYRKLKPDARKVACPGDDRVAVSVADCRMSCFDTITKATELWIKGVTFSVAKLLGDEELAKKYEGGALAIFRLAPQDYHRFHSPVQGTVVTDAVKIDGTYFTVNPMAVNHNVDVFTENVRKVTIIGLDQSQDEHRNEQFDKCVFVSIGALLVGSIVLTGAQEQGTKILKGDELGYFAYGGSTCIVLFKKDAVQFDQDLLNTSLKGLETLVKVGERIGARK
ncbi:hypothetical protein BGW38_008898 [Lunasporangiospora selenospora]|uniref:C2 domain-containing protein n=1 Tax=Lunasporangiospora selenospora TaxID=979761 RepID=A0A9P6KIF3_9FUNG|nr:hypothetical protein BGW38_008898 [Lunasporangiospora selenospora]